MHYSTAGAERYARQQQFVVGEGGYLFTRERFTPIHLSHDQQRTPEPRRLNCQGFSQWDFLLVPFLLFIYPSRQSEGRSSHTFCICIGSNVPAALRNTKQSVSANTSRAPPLYVLYNNRVSEPCAGQTLGTGAEALPRCAARAPTKKELST